jgi:hypothetical protein
VEGFDDAVGCKRVDVGEDIFGREERRLVRAALDAAMAAEDVALVR